MIKNYNNFINESLLKGINKNQIKDKIKNLSFLKQLNILKDLKNIKNTDIINILGENYIKDMLYSSNLSLNEKIRIIINHDFNHDLLYRDDNGICVYKGDLNILHVKNLNIPINFRVTNNFIIFSNGNTNSELILPNGLVVGNDLECDDLNMTYLPNDLMVGNNLYIETNKITKIPETIKVVNTIFIKNNPIDYEKLPKKFKYYK